MRNISKIKSSLPFNKCRVLLLVSITFLLLFHLTSISFGQDNKAVLEIDKLMNNHTKQDQFSGVVLVAKNGQVVYKKAFGYANKEMKIPNTIDTPFNICSMGKMFTAAAIMQLYENRKLSLTDTIDKYLSGFSKEIAEKVTIHHLLCHTAGFGNYMAHKDYNVKKCSQFPIEKCLRLIETENLRFRPKERFSYSNSGYVVLGAIIEKITGKHYDEYFKDNILVPLNMLHTSFKYDESTNRVRGYVKQEQNWVVSSSPEPAPSADGGARSTIIDILKFDTALHQYKILSKETTRLMFTPNKNGYGYGLSIKPPEEHLSRKVSIGHTGGLNGLSTVYRHFVPDDITIIVLSNYHMVAFEVCRKLEAIIFNIETSQNGR